MGDPENAPPQKPVAIYDGDCGFCKKWVARWHQSTGGSVEFRPSSEAAADFPSIPKEDFDNALQLVRTNGTRCQGAGAVLELTAPHSLAAKLGLLLFRKCAPFRNASNAAYGFVANNRTVFSLLTKLLWGGSPERPSFAVSNMVFLRALAVVFLIFLWSYEHQFAGLNGEKGILPVGDFFRTVQSQLGDGTWCVLPSLVWLAPGDAAVGWLCGIGSAAAVLALLGTLQPLCFAILWIVTLSLISAGQDFYSYQWDALLVETGFLAIFLSPWAVRPNLAACAPPRTARFAALFLLFKLMFCSGVVKFASGDKTWADLTALEFHFFTQPLPNPAAWFAQNLPPGVLEMLCLGMFAIELAVPFLFFLPRIPRTAAAAATVALQLGIALTGNYAYFNLLTIALCLFLLDDSIWPRMEIRSAPFLPAWLRRPTCIALVALGLVPTILAFRVSPPWMEPLARVYSAVAPWRTVNGYGLFAVMTTTRREIIVQGSNDGFEWKTYGFRYKPGPLDRPPPIVAPYQPRLDWQMWFAALGRIETTPWFQSFLFRLLQGEPAVLALLEHNPFPEKPPRFLRAVSDIYEFTTPAERAKNGDWWKSEPAAIYCPSISLRED